MTLRMPEEGKAGFGASELRLLLLKEALMYAINVWV
jgi:hypothetical protein